MVGMLRCSPILGGRPLLMASKDSPDHRAAIAAMLGTAPSASQHSTSSSSDDKRMVPLPAAKVPKLMPSTISVAPKLMPPMSVAPKPLPPIRVALGSAPSPIAALFKQQPSPVGSSQGSSIVAAASFRPVSREPRRAASPLPKALEGGLSPSPSSAGKNDAYYQQCVKELIASVMCCHAGSRRCGPAPVATATCRR